MPNYRYPESINDGNSPFLLFSTYRPEYEEGALGKRVNIRKEETIESVALYVPPGYSVTDSIRYENMAGGLAGALISKYQEGQLSDVTIDDVQAVGSQFAKELIPAIGAGIGVGAGGGLIGGAGGLITGAAFSGNIQATIQQSRQRILNPREFKLFNAPTMRQFSFTFTFIPQSESEAKAVPEIVKFFRKASYPALHERGLDYIFPELFRVQFIAFDENRRKHMPVVKMPEVVCSGIQTTYNPNSMSYFKQGSMPVEVNLSLTFEELRAIDRNQVEEGY